MTAEALKRYIVNVPPGGTVAEAVAQHRERWGHGGMCVIVFEKTRGRKLPLVKSEQSRAAA
jgi:hypothetical protein